MSKILDATCQGRTVTADQIPVPDAEILSEGQGQSEGVLLLEGERVRYLTSNASDLKTSIEKVVNSIDKIASILTAIGAGMTGSTTAPPPTLAADVAALQAIGTELTTLKGNLK